MSRRGDRGLSDDDMGAFLRGLPDDIAVAREHGLAIVLELDDEPAAAVRMLMRTLGVPVKVRCRPVVTD